MRTPDLGRALGVCGTFVTLALACSSEDDVGTTADGGGGGQVSYDYSREELLDPETCKDCHPVHYEQWSGSMHAYAADDPVFRAMNERGQDETGGALGGFCIGCHAPMAVAEGATEDGTNLEDVPKHLRGVTCYFCHNVDRIEGEHTNPLILANDTTMRGGIGSRSSDPPPTVNDVHASAYSPLVDGRSIESAQMCGACHDIVVPKDFSGATEDVHLERTYAEWRDGLYNTEDDLVRQTCVSCHAKRDGTRGVIADFEGVPGGRRVHLHDFEGVDLALTDWPGRQRQKILVEQALGTSLTIEMCVSQLGAVRVGIDNSGAGHSFPSGAAQDRRVWVELTAVRVETDGSETVLYQSGSVGAGEPVTELADPDLWLLRDYTYKSNGEEAHMFWDIAEIDSQLIPGIKSRDSNHPEFHRELKYRDYSGTFSLGTFPDRVMLRVRVRPMGLDVLREVQTDPGLPDSVVDAMQILDVLPNRCYPPEIRDAYPGVVPQAECDPDPSLDNQKYSLVWTRDAADASGLTADVNGDPALCVSQTTRR